MIVVCTKVRDNRALVAKNVASGECVAGGVRSYYKFSKYANLLTFLRKKAFLFCHVKKKPYLCTANMWI